MDREAWRAGIHGVAKSRTRLSDWTELNWKFLGVPVIKNPPSNAGKWFWSLVRELRSRIHAYVHTKLLQLCLTLCDPMDCSPPGSPAPGILSARVPEWVSIPYSRGFSQPRDQTHISYLLHWEEGSLPLAPLGKPTYLLHVIFFFSFIFFPLLNWSHLIRGIKQKAEV